MDPAHNKAALGQLLHPAHLLPARNPLLVLPVRRALVAPRTRQLPALRKRLRKQAAQSVVPVHQLRVARLAQEPQHPDPQQADLKQAPCPGHMLSAPHLRRNRKDKAADHALAPNPPHPAQLPDPQPSARPMAPQHLARPLPAHRLRKRRGPALPAPAAPACTTAAT